MNTWIGGENMIKKINGKFYQSDILSVEQFTIDDIARVFDVAAFYKKGTENGVVFSDLSGMILTALFYEPSSRTFGSFCASMQRLGGGIIPIQGVTYSSVVKGESLTDTINTFQSYSDVIVIRHPEEGAAAKAAEAARIPIINAGDGVGEHPTQALLDLFTIKDRLKRLDHITIAMIGDLKYGRTVHSLAKLLSLYKDSTMYVIHPEQSPMPESVLTLIKKRGVVVRQAKTIEEIIKKVDVLYMTRVQKERMSAELYDKIKGAFKLTSKLANSMRKDAIIMHPLPRVGEVELSVDVNPRACYLQHQMRNGLFVRMALLRLILKK